MSGERWVPIVYRCISFITIYVLGFAIERYVTPYFLSVPAVKDHLGSMGKMPVLFLGHGGGPLPLLGDPSHSPLVKHLSSVSQLLPDKPRGVLVISGHWEEAKPTVTSGESPQVIYDYYGFPAESYQIKYPAKGDPALAKQVASLLREAGYDAAEDAHRGWDHGTFVPLKLVFPEADVPLVQLSLLASMSAADHIKLGETVAPLRDQGVLVLGSGMTFHNMSAFNRGSGNPSSADSTMQKSQDFDEYLRDACTNGAHTPEERKQLLADWAKAPQARFAHPREDHLLPLHVAVGAAGADAGTAIFNDALFGVKISSFKFG